MNIPGFQKIATESVVGPLPAFCDTTKNTIGAGSSRSSLPTETTLPGIFKSDVNLGVPRNNQFWLPPNMQNLGIAIIVPFSSVSRNKVALIDGCLTVLQRRRVI